MIALLPYLVAASITVGGKTRTYLLDTPSTGAAGKPLVIMLHGWGGDAAQCRRDYGMSRIGEDSGFTVVYPEGLRSPGGLRSWNSGGCCAWAGQQGIDDVGFISALIDSLVARYHIDSHRVYAAGMSNGAMMAYRLACVLSGRIAAIAAVSGTMTQQTACRPVRAIPILHIHSVRDTKVPYTGGDGLGGQYFRPVDSTLRIWAALDSCDRVSPSTRQSYTLTTWLRQNKTMIQCYLTTDGGHAWPGGKKPRAAADDPSTALDASVTIWEFFRSYRL